MKKLLTIFFTALMTCILLCGLSWARHFFVIGLNPFAGMLVLGVFLLLVTSVIIWMIRSKGRWVPRFTPVQLFLMGGLCWLMAGVLFQLFLGNSTLDILLHDTYFVANYSFSSVVIAILFFVLALIYSVYRGIAGRPLIRWMGYWHFGVTFAVAYFACWPGRIIPRITDIPFHYFEHPNGWSVGVVLSWDIVTVAFVLAQVLFLFNLVYTSLRGSNQSGGAGAAVLVGLMLLLSACHKDASPADPYDLAQNTAEQNAKLITGYWIEDSARVDGVKTFITLPPSFLSIDANLHYMMYQTVTGSTANPSDTGYLVFDGNRNIQPISVGGSHYFAGFDRLVISEATDHRLVLYDYESQANNITLFYHK